MLAERLLAPIRAADVDALLLGCTHYPFLARVIGDVMGHGRDARQLGRRDRVRRPPRARRARPAARRRRPRRRATASCRAATSTRSASSAPGCSAPSSTTPHRGSRPRPDRSERTPDAPPRRPRPRRAAPHHVRARLHRDGRRLVPRVVRPDPCAVHGQHRRRRAALDAGHGQGLGDRRVLDAARARRPSGSTARRPRASRAGAPSRSSG